MLITETILKIFDGIFWHTFCGKSDEQTQPGIKQIFIAEFTIKYIKDLVGSVDIDRELQTIDSTIPGFDFPQKLKSYLTDIIQLLQQFQTVHPWFLIIIELLAQSFKVKFEFETEMQIFEIFNRERISNFQRFALDDQEFYRTERLLSQSGDYTSFSDYVATLIKGQNSQNEQTVPNQQAENRNPFDSSEDEAAKKAATQSTGHRLEPVNPENPQPSPSQQEEQVK